MSRSNDAVPVTDVAASEQQQKDDDELDANRDQRELAVKLSHYVHTLLCIISNQMTTIENLQAQLGEIYGYFTLINYSLFSTILLSRY